MHAHIFNHTADYKAQPEQFSMNLRCVGNKKFGMGHRSV
jgi:hypothetical protein